MRKIKITNADTKEFVVVDFDDDDPMEIEPFVNKYVQSKLDWDLDDVRYEVTGTSEDED